MTPTDSAFQISSPGPSRPRALFLSSLLLVASLACIDQVRACTTMLATAAATTDGSILVSHTNDGSAQTDPRFVFVPAADHAPGSLRPIYPSPENYPRYVGTDRNVPAYYPTKTQQAMPPIGFIPQVAHTFHYFEETYGAMNEHQLTFGESTCSCVDWVAKGGNPSKPCANTTDSNCALLSIDQLAQIAMERATSAREAITIMGALAEAHGFYGQDSFEGSAESLLIADGKEGWIFHILPHPSGSSAIWAAQRVPDGHVAVVANMFIIRTVNLSDTDNFLGSASMASIANQYGLGSTCPRTDSCDFTGTFSDGEYGHKYYSGRRVWRGLSLLSPDSLLNATYNNLKADKPYPPTVPVDPLSRGHRISLAAFMDAHRDHYEDTPYDMTQGLAAGPFGNPNRNAGGRGESQVHGNWERAISIPRTSDSQIGQTRGWLPAGIGGVLWFGPHVPHATSYTPFPAAMTTVPKAFYTGRQGEYAPPASSAFWAVRDVANQMEMKFNYTKKDVGEAQSLLLSESLSLLAKFEKAWESPDQQDVEKLTQAFTANAELMLVAYENLRTHLLYKYADGWINEPILGQGVGYPPWWLKAVGYPNGPGPV